MLVPNAQSRSHYLRCISNAFLHMGTLAFEGRIL